MNIATNLVNAAKFALTPTSKIEAENERLFSLAVVRVKKVKEVDFVLNRLIPGIENYKKVSEIINKDMPWWVVMLVHAMEAGAKQFPFNYHLHCGDPLSSRTFHVPAGRPKFNPGHGNVGPSPSNPYSWNESAVDALLLSGFDKITNWSLGNVLWIFEKFNGTGYRKYHPTVPTPYIWSFTTIYTKGKYVLDGKFDKEAVSKQPGCACYLIRLFQKGVIAKF